MKSFTRGDRVIVIAIIDCPPLARWVPSMDASLHTRGVIIDVSTDANGIIVIKVKLDSGITWWYHPDCLELVIYKSKMSTNSCKCSYRSNG